MVRKQQHWPRWDRAVVPDRFGDGSIRSLRTVKKIHKLGLRWIEVHIVSGADAKFLCSTRKGESTVNQRFVKLFLISLVVFLKAESWFA